MLGISDDLVYKLLNTGDLGFIKASTAKLIPCEELDRYVDTFQRGGVT